MVKTWCVLANDGIWCATAGDAESDEAALSVATRCRQSITLPLGVSKRSPTCQACLDAIRLSATSAIALCEEV